MNQPTIESRIVEDNIRQPPAFHPTETAHTVTVQYTHTRTHTARVEHMRTQLHSVGVMYCLSCLNVTGRCVHSTAFSITVSSSSIAFSSAIRSLLSDL